MITIAPGAPADFENLNTFVLLRAMRFGGLVADAVAERTERETLTHPHRAIFRLRRGFGGHVVAKDDGILAGFVIVDWKDQAMPEIRLR